MQPPLGWSVDSDPEGIECAEVVFGVAQQAPRVRALRGDKRPGLCPSHPEIYQIHRSTEVCYLAWRSS